MPARAQPLRRDDQAAYVLHTYAYRETSLIVEALTEEHGRVALVARGAKRPRSDLRGLLQAFQPLLQAWSGHNELKTRHKAEWRGGLPLLGGAALLCGFYLNELLLKLLPREDPHPRLFLEYESALDRLARGEDQAPILRQFEPAERYSYAFERGPRTVAAEPGRRYPQVRGATLLALARDDYAAPESA